MSSNQAKIWKRASCMLNASYIRDCTSQETEFITEIIVKQNQEETIAAAERQLKSDLITAYTERKNRIEKLEQLLEVIETLPKNSKLRSDLRSIIFAENDDFVASFVIDAPKKK